VQQSGKLRDCPEEPILITVEFLLTRPLQPTRCPYDYSTVAEDEALIDGRSRDGNARTRLNSSFGNRKFQMK